MVSKVMALSSPDPLPRCSIEATLILRAALKKNYTHLQFKYFEKTSHPFKHVTPVLLGNMNFYHQWEFSLEFISSSSWNDSCYPSDL